MCEEGRKRRKEGKKNIRSFKVKLHLTLSGLSISRISYRLSAISRILSHVEPPSAPPPGKYFKLNKWSLPA